MHMLGILIFMTAAYQHNIARANGFCEPPFQADNTVPVYERHPVNARIRIQCAEGYVRKAGTSNLITCTEKNGNASWDSKLPIQCIRDPKKPHRIKACMKTSTVSEENGKVEATFSDYISTIGGVTSIIIICLAAAGFLVWWRWRLRRRETNGIPLYHTNPDDMTYVPVPVSASEHCSAEPNKAANKPTTDSDNDTNQPQTDPAHSVDTCDKLLPQTDSC